MDLDFLTHLMEGKQMPIWKSDDEQLILTEMGHDYVAFNIFSEELVIGIMLNRTEIEELCNSLLEYCGIPIFEVKNNDEE